jgi:hypothetical protein
MKGRDESRRVSKHDVEGTLLVNGGEDIADVAPTRRLLVMGPRPGELDDLECRETWQEEPLTVTKEIADVVIAKRRGVADHFLYGALEPRVGRGGRAPTFPLTAIDRVGKRFGLDTEVPRDERDHVLHSGSPLSPVYADSRQIFLAGVRYRSAAMPDNRAILHAYDRHGHVVKRRTMDLHRYWDAPWDLLDDLSARRAAGVRRMSGLLYGSRGALLQVWENRYDARGRLVSTDAWHFDERGKLQQRTT